MNNIIIIQSQNGNLVVSSREVAENFEKRHNDVVEVIEGKIENLTTENIVVENYFIPSTFNHKGNNYKEYLLTRDGFTFIVMGFTGAKADRWKLKYIEAFNKMEEKLRQQAIDVTKLSPELQMFKQIFDSVAKTQLEQQKIGQALNEVKQEVETTKEVIQNVKDTLLVRDEDWRNSISKMLNKVSKNSSMSYQEVRTESYKTLEDRARCNLSIRLGNLKDRLNETGATKTQINNANKLDVIESDVRLKEIYTSIVKEMSIKYVA